MNEPVNDPEARTFLVDYLAQARAFATSSADRFAQHYVSELSDIEDYIEVAPGDDRIAALHLMCKRHGKQVMAGARWLNDPTLEVRKNTLLSMLADREYLKTPVTRLADDISGLLSRALPLAFGSRKPASENEFNDVVDATLNGRKPELAREHPSLSFGRAKTIPDHLSTTTDLAIESKYIRGSTSPSKATDGLAADMFKLPSHLFKLMIVYDPERAIRDDEEFRSAFESRGNCRVVVVR